MPLIRKRRARHQDEDAAENSESSERDESRTRSRSNRRQRQGDDPDTALEDATLDGAPNDDDESGYVSESGSQPFNTRPLARKLCRYVLACEYARQPVRRADINAKVLPLNAGRVFKAVFAEAQDMLRSVFGMEMVEMPAKDKVTLQQRRAAQKQKQDNANKQTSASSNAWVLVSTLPQKYRAADIIPPPSVPTQEQESAYVALYTFIISSIYLAGGALPESRLERLLRRMNADRTTPLGQTDVLLKRLMKDQYITKVVDRSSASEDSIEYVVGPRGKMEVGEEGVAGLVRAVYGNSVEDLEKRLDNSLGIGAANEQARRAHDQQNGADTGQTSQRTQVRKARPGRKKQQLRNNQDEHSAEDEDAEMQSDDDDDD